jgi:hypothetical protein
MEEEYGDLMDFFATGLAIDAKERSVWLQEVQDKITSMRALAKAYKLMYDAAIEAELKRSVEEKKLLQEASDYKKRVQQI